MVEILSGAVSSLPYLINDLIEVKRVLKPGAFLLLIHAAYKDDRFEKRNNKLVNLLNIVIHTPDEYKDFLSEAGYRIEHLYRLTEKNRIGIPEAEAVLREARNEISMFRQHSDYFSYAFFVMRNRADVSSYG